MLKYLHLLLILIDCDRTDVLCDLNSMLEHSLLLTTHIHIMFLLFGNNFRNASVVVLLSYTASLAKMVRSKKEWSASSEGNYLKSVRNLSKIFRAWRSSKDARKIQFLAELGLSPKGVKFRLCPPGQNWPHRRGHLIYLCYRNILKSLFSETDRTSL